MDGDIATNHWQWQMQAGITNPLSPTFRMNNPTKNFKERDPTAAYVHFWLPETNDRTVAAILESAKPMLDFDTTRKSNGKVISDIRKSVRERIIQEKGLELSSAVTVHETVVNYGRYTADAYKRYMK